eukprot:SAG31_NODE_23583_length_501_cov_0.898010_1_plen_59_part_01
MARKWYGVTDPHLQPNFHTDQKRHRRSKMSFLESDPAFIDGNHHSGQLLPCAACNGGAR